MKLGIIDHAINWTPTAGAYFAWEIACGIFVTIPFVTFTVLSGLQSIDDGFYEAATVDGADYWQKMFQITIPLVRPSLTVSTVLKLSMYLTLSDYLDHHQRRSGKPDGYIGYFTCISLRILQWQTGDAAAVSVIGFLILFICASIYMISV